LTFALPMRMKLESLLGISLYHDIKLYVIRNGTKEWFPLFELLTVFPFNYHTVALLLSLKVCGC
jgi:hypothetical protein